MSDWLTIRVVMTGRRGAPLPLPPGRVLLACADHTFADLAEAIDTAFGRWDLDPLHRFELDGRVLSATGARSDDEEGDDTEDVLLGEVGLRAGMRFSYLFDLGAEWLHDCVVEAADVDPFELAEDEPDVPVPVDGWGTLPDQHDRLVEDEQEQPEALAAVPDDEDGAPEEDWGDAEADSWEVVAHALSSASPPADPAALAGAAAGLRDPSPAGAEAAAPAASVLFAAAGIEAADAPSDDEELWILLAAGIVRPDPDVPLDDDAVAAWSALEPADWAGAVIELVRAGAGSTASPEALLEMVARCPEIEGEQLSEEDEAVILEGFEVVVALWRALGVLGDDGELTPLGAWGLPRALERAWAPAGA